VRSETLLTCEDVAERLSDAPDGALSLDPGARRHVEGCLRCQAEAIQHRKLRRALRGLRDELSAPRPGLLVELLSAVDTDAERRGGRLSLPAPLGPVGRRRVAYVGGLAAAATAAGVGGAVVLVTRTRRRLPLAG
jgi:anti-sigma factor RsiW